IERVGERVSRQVTPPVVLTSDELPAERRVRRSGWGYLPGAAGAPRCARGGEHRPFYPTDQWGSRPERNGDNLACKPGSAIDHVLPASDPLQLIPPRGGCPWRPRATTCGWPSSIRQF